MQLTLATLIVLVVSLTSEYLAYVFVYCSRSQVLCKAEGGKGFGAVKPPKTAAKKKAKVAIVDNKTDVSFWEFTHVHINLWMRFSSGRVIRNYTGIAKLQMHGRSELRVDLNLVWRLGEDINFNDLLCSTGESQWCEAYCEEHTLFTSSAIAILWVMAHNSYSSCFSSAVLNHFESFKYCAGCRASSQTSWWLQERSNRCKRSSSRASGLCQGICLICLKFPCELHG